MVQVLLKKLDVFEGNN